MRTSVVITMMMIVKRKNTNIACMMVAHAIPCLHAERMHTSLAECSAPTCQVHDAADEWRTRRLVGSYYQWQRGNKLKRHFAHRSSAFCVKSRSAVVAAQQIQRCAMTCLHQKIGAKIIHNNPNQVKHQHCFLSACRLWLPTCCISCWASLAERVLIHVCK